MGAGRLIEGVWSRRPRRSTPIRGEHRRIRIPSRLPRADVGYRDAQRVRAVWAAFKPRWAGALAWGSRRRLGLLLLVFYLAAGVWFAWPR